MKRDDLWSERSFELHPAEGGYCGFEIMADGSLEFNACEPRDKHMEWYENPDNAVIRLTPEHTLEFLAGLQAWLEQLKSPAL